MPVYMCFVEGNKYKQDYKANKIFCIINDANPNNEKLTNLTC